MDISPKMKNKYQAKIRSGNCTPKDAFANILKIWTEDKGKNATVEKLVNYMEECLLKDVAGMLI